MGYPRQDGAGELTLHQPAGPALRIKTFTCAHCSQVTELERFTRPADAGAICKSCMKPICLSCAAKRIRGEPCDPWEAKLERIEAAYARSRA